MHNWAEYGVRMMKRRTQPCRRSRGNRRQYFASRKPRPRHKLRNRATLRASDICEAFGTSRSDFHRRDLSAYGCVAVRLVVAYGTLGLPADDSGGVRNPRVFSAVGEPQAT